MSGSTIGTSMLRGRLHSPQLGADMQLSLKEQDIILTWL